MFNFLFGDTILFKRYKNQNIKYVSKNEIVIHIYI